MCSFLFGVAGFSILFLFFLAFVCFSNPTSPPWSSIGLVPYMVQCVPAYTLSSTTDFQYCLRIVIFKKVATALENVLAGTFLPPAPLQRLLNCIVLYLLVTSFFKGATISYEILLASLTNNKIFLLTIL